MRQARSRGGGGVRVTGGVLAGRALRTPTGGATRPTGDLVRAAIFDALWANPLLLPRREGLRVLDLFAGSGALGIEALSRGADVAHFVESAPPALAALRHNIESLGLRERATLVARPVTRALAGPVVGGAGGFDLVLADPPYALGAGATLQALMAGSLVLPGGLCVVQHAAREELPERGGSWARLWHRAYGGTVVSMYGDRPAGP